MKNLILSFVLLMLMSINVFSQTLSVTMDAPSESDGSYFDITAELTFDQSTWDDFYLDVSFPDGVQSVEITNLYDWDPNNSGVYEPGDLIYHRYGNQIIATDYLVSAFVDRYTGYQDLRLKIRVYPNISGEIDIYYRGTRSADPIQIYPTSSGTYDQQGWPVKVKTVWNAPDDLPDLKLTNIKVNNDNDFFEDEEVTIKAYVKEINDVDAGRVLVKFYVDGSYVGEDETSDIDAGEEEYASIPYTFSNDRQYVVKAVADPNNAIIEDSETNNTREENVTPLQNHAPTMSNISGSVSGTSYSATWSGSDPDGHDVEYRYKLDSQSWSSWSSGTSKSYSGLSYGSHTFYVECQDELGKDGNSDSDPFTISDTRSVTVSTPNGGEQWMIGTTETISWTYTGVPSVIIVELTRNNGSSYEELTRFNNQSAGQYQWPVSGSASTQCKIRVRIQYTDGVWKNDLSNSSFTIQANQAPTVTLNNPQVNGQSVSLSWSGSDPDGHDVEYCYKLDNGSWSEWGSSTSKSYSNLSYGSHTFYVQCRDELELNGNTASKSFNIVEPNHPPTVVLGDPVVNDQSVLLSWSGSDPDGHDVVYSFKLDDNNWSAWTSNTSKSYSGLVSGDHDFYVKCKDEFDLEGNTDQVTFNVSEPTGVVLNYPNGGEEWEIGVAENIVWNYSGTPVLIIVELSRDDGASYEELIRYENQSVNQYDWEVTGPVSEQCRIRIHTQYSDGSIAEDASNNNFQIYEEYLASYSIVLGDDDGNQYEVISLDPYRYYDDDGNETISWFIDPIKTASLSIQEGMMPFLIYDNIGIPLARIFGMSNFANLETLMKINIPLPRSWFTALPAEANDPFLHLRIDLGHIYPSGDVNPNMHFHIAIGKKMKRAVSFIGQNNFVKVTGRNLGQLINIEKPKFLTNLNMSNIKVNIGTFLGWFVNNFILASAVVSVLNYGQDAHWDCEYWERNNYSLINDILNNPDLEPISKTGLGFIGEYTYEDLVNTPCEQYSIIKVKSTGVSDACYYSSSFQIDWLNVEDFIDVYAPKYLYNMERNGANCDNASAWSYFAYIPGSVIKITYPDISGYITPEPEIVTITEPILEISKEYIPNASVMFDLQNSELGLSILTPQGIVVTEEDYNSEYVTFYESFSGKKMILRYGNGEYQATVHKPDSTIGMSYSLYTQNQLAYDTLAIDIPITSSGDDVYGVDSITSVQSGLEHIKDYSLSQNYPNPFNPTTEIQYAIPENEYVILEIYNCLGERVETLVNKEMSAGRHRVTFDAGKLANGVYMYRLQAGSFSESRKMILLK